MNDNSDAISMRVKTSQCIVFSRLIISRQNDFQEEIPVNLRFLANWKVEVQALFRKEPKRQESPF